MESGTATVTARCPQNGMQPGQAAAAAAAAARRAAAQPLTALLADRAQLDPRRPLQSAPGGAEGGCTHRRWCSGGACGRLGHQRGCHGCHSSLHGEEDGSNGQCVGGEAGRPVFIEPALRGLLTSPPSEALPLLVRLQTTPTYPRKVERAATEPQTACCL